MKTWALVLLVASAGAGAWLRLAPNDTAGAVASAVCMGPADNPAAPVSERVQLQNASGETSLLDPDEAAASILAQPPADRLAAASATLIEFVDDPVAAAALARTLCTLDPELVREHGNTLITVLTEAGNYLAALRFAASGGPESILWKELTFAHWARSNPRQAAEAVLADPNADGLAIVCAEWTAQDPAGLAAFLCELPPAAAAAIHAVTSR